MGCRLTQDIKHGCEYNPGGIRDICLVDIRDFIAYQFKGDGLYDECYVESIRAAEEKYVHLDVVNESNFVESKENDIYKQELTTFIRTLGHEKTSQLLQASADKHLVILRTNDDRAFTFGSDGGASLRFTQQTGQVGESTGYNITLSKESIYPLFEIDTTIPIDRAKLFDRFFDKFFD